VRVGFDSGVMGHGIRPLVSGVGLGGYLSNSQFSYWSFLLEGKHWWGVGRKLKLWIGLGDPTDPRGGKMSAVSVHIPSSSSSSFP